MPACDGSSFATPLIVSGADLLLRTPSAALALAGALVLLPAAVFAQTDSLLVSAPRDTLALSARRDTLVLSAPRDTLLQHYEVGVGYDLTNEIQFDQPFDTTAIQRRERVTEADGRLVGIGAATLELRYAGRSRLLLDQLLQAGPELVREQLHADWRHALPSLWRWLGGADLDYRHDTSFGLTRDDLLAGARLGAERAPLDYSSSLRLLYRFDLGNSQQEGAVRIYPDFYLHRAQIAYAHYGDLGSEWGLGYTLGYRSFPDTSARDYVDHQGEAFGRVRFGAGTEISARAGLDRRDAFSDSATGDRFWQSDDELSLRQPISFESWWLTIAGRFFGTGFDVPTAALFNTFYWRQSAELRYEPGAAWAGEATLEAEELRAPNSGGLGDPDVSEDALNARREEYDQAALKLGLERIGATTVFFEPAGGRRRYRIEATPANDLEAHSSYWFVSANGYADARLAHRFRFRASADYLYEFHDISADDVSSIYLTAELRYALGR